MGKNYGVKQFKTELKSAMQMAAVDGQRVFLLLEDHNLNDSRFLDMINSLLSSGEVPGLYSPEELEPLLTPLREKASNDGFSGNLISYFAACVRKNLHVILIMDCTGKDFITNCESNPALYKECQVIWLENWSETSMVDFPRLLLESGGSGDEDAKKRQRNVSGGDQLMRNFYQVSLNDLKVMT